METLSAYFQKSLAPVAAVLKQKKRDLSASKAAGGKRAGARGASQESGPQNLSSGLRRGERRGGAGGREAKGQGPRGRLSTGRFPASGAGKAGDLPAAARQTAVFVRTKPSGALVYVNRRFAARTPGIVQIPGPNRPVEILISKKGYAPKTVTVSNGSSLGREITIPLKRRSPSSY